MSDDLARGNELARHVGLREAVEVFVAAKAEMIAALDRIEAAELRLEAALGASYRVHLRTSREGDVVHAGRRALVELEADAWRQIFEKLEVGRFLSVKRRDELEAMLQRKRGAPELPPLTVENAVSLLQGFHGQLDELLTESVGEVFERLRPRDGTKAARLKSNSQFEVGERVVLTGAVDLPWMRTRAKSCWSHALSHREEPYMAALERVFLSLDGKGSVTTHHRSEVGMRLREAPVGETPYFSFKACRNGNLHLRFKRLDLLARFNALAGGARLKPSTAA